MNTTEHFKPQPTFGLTIADISEISGRSAFMALAKANEQATQQILIEMKELARVSKVDGSSISLTMSKNGQRRYLRWNLRHRNSSWELVRESLKDLPAAVQKHYIAINRRVQELNALASVCNNTRGDLHRLMLANDWIKPVKTIF